MGAGDGQKGDTMRNQFRLNTKEGTHVADVPVPHFDLQPDVVIWGDRVFTFYSAISTGGDPCSCEYREATAFLIPIPLAERSADHPAFKVTEPTNS